MEDFTIVSLNDYKYKPSIAVSAPYVGDDKKHWTDGHTLLRRDCVSRPIKRMYETTAKYQREVGVGKKRISRLWESQWLCDSEKAITPELVRCAGVDNYYHRSTVMLTTESGKTALLSADIVKFLMMKIKNCSFRIPTDNKYSAIQIMSGRKRAGLVMPMRL